MAGKNSRITISLIIVVAVLVFTGTSLLMNRAGSASVQNQEGGGLTPPSPDFTAFAESVCCDQGTPWIQTPSQEQIDLWTEVALTQSSRYTGVEQTLTPVPPVNYLEPSGKWAEYVNEEWGYRFDYPDNWYIIDELVAKQPGVAIQNSSPEELAVKGAEMPIPDKIKIIIYPTADMGQYKTLEEYLADPIRAAANPASTYLKSETSPNGYQIVWQQEAITQTFLIA